MAILVKEPEIILHGFRWVVIHKPAGMLAHTVGGEEVDAIQWLTDHLNQNSAFSKSCSFDPQYSLHPIHRLDREVSGLMLIALDKKTSNHLHQQFENRDVQKCYYALVQNNKPEMDPSGEWTWKLTKKAEGRSKPAGFAKYRVPCHTSYEILETNEDVTLLKLIPHTGRKHQLRRHCALAGTPIIGDPRYGEEHEAGLQLMSCLLNFKDPKTGTQQNIEIEPTFELI